VCTYFCPVGHFVCFLRSYLEENYEDIFALFLERHQEGIALDDTALWLKDLIEKKGIQANSEDGKPPTLSVCPTVKKHTPYLTTRWFALLTSRQFLH